MRAEMFLLVKRLELQLNDPLVREQLQRLKLPDKFLLPLLAGSHRAGEVVVLILHVVRELELLQLNDPVLEIVENPLQIVDSVVPLNDSVKQLRCRWIHGDYSCARGGVRRSEEAEARWGVS